MSKHLSTHIESDLLLKVSDGDEFAFRQLYISYRAFIKTSIKKYIPDDDICEEFVQQVFVSLWEHRTSLADVKSLQDYLFIVTRNKVFKYFSHLRKEAMIMRALATRQHAEAEQPNLSVELRDYHVAWDKAIQSLPAQQKTVYTMIEKDEESIEAVANILGLTRSTTKKHLELARKAVRKFITLQLESGRFPKLLAAIAIISIFIF